VPNDLARTTVILDFDGAAVMHGPFAGAAGREAVQALWDRLPHDEGILRSAARQVVIDPALGPLLDDLRAAGAEVVVVADGLGLDAEQALASYDVRLLTNAIDWASGELTFPNADSCCACATCGVCKQASVREAQAAGRRAVLVGALPTDVKAAALADEVFARDALARWCDDFDVPYQRFVGLADVRHTLLGAPKRADTLN
jgi:2-hydroxy-3-keto-5-methylthiopentenyl-1-phosphate phosphatase